MSRVFRVLLKSPPISSVMNNFLSHHYATLIAQNSKLPLQFEFVFPYFAIYTSWQLKECLLAPPQCHFGCSKLVAQSYHTALGSVPWLHKEMREGGGWVLLKFLKQNHSAFVAISAHCHVHSIFAKTFCKIFVNVCSSSVFTLIPCLQDV